MKQRIKNYLLSKVCRVIIPDDIVTLRKDGAVLLGGKVLTETEKRALNAEAKALENMRIWSILCETVKQISHERGWNNSTTIEHLNTAKTMYSILETQQTIVQKFRDMVK